MSRRNEEAEPTKNYVSLKRICRFWDSFGNISSETVSWQK